MQNFGVFLEALVVCNGKALKMQGVRKVYVKHAK